LILIEWIKSAQTPWALTSDMIYYRQNYAGMVVDSVLSRLFVKMQE
jgi:hypothetical protein